MELKSKFLHLSLMIIPRFNRTFMELKLEIPNLVKALSSF